MAKYVRKGKYTKSPSRIKRTRAFAQRTWTKWQGLSWKKKTMIIAAPILAFLIITPLATYLYYAHDISDENRLMNTNNTGIVLYDRNGQELYSIGKADHRTLVPLNQISTNMQHALVASEDKDFYQHGAVSVLSTVRAIYGYVLHGGGSFGGSTITQQLAKITLLSSQRSAFRQYQALAVALAIENTYSKDQILDMYLNAVYFGENSFGIEDAAKVYFGTTPDKLDLAQSAMLVGLLPAPSTYSPISGSVDLAKQRQKSVLGRMVTSGYITQDQATAAENEPLQYQSPQTQTSSAAPNFVSMVLDQLYNKYGQETVLRSGYQVHTTLDLTMQNDLQKNLTANAANIQRHGGSNASAIEMDPKTGEVRALVGSLDYNNPDWGKVNMATSPRQPASTFKSIYYAGALANGTITPATVLEDEPINIDGWQPTDADGRWRGQVTVRSAISMSLNIPSIHVMQKYGLSNSIQMAQKLGISAIKTDGNYGLSLAIGSAEVPLIEMTHAYTAFANQGFQHPTTLISSVNDRFGKQIFKADETGSQNLSPAGAFLISSILSDNSARAPMFGSTLSVPGHTVAVKTGTTDDFKDALAIGWTPSVVLGVWAGNNDNTAMDAESYQVVGPIFKQTMLDVLGKSNEQFPIPSTVVKRATCYGNHGIAINNSTYDTYPEYYLSSALPSITCSPVKPQPIQVCNLQTMQQETIDEKDFNDTMYSKDLTQCQQIQVCNLATGQVETIKQSDYDPTKYSKDTTNCTASNGGTNPPPTGTGGGNGGGTGTKPSPGPGPGGNGH